MGQAVHLLEGDEYIFTCLAEQGFPRPVFYWSVGNTSAMMRLHADQEVRYATLNGAELPLFIVL